MQRRVGGGGRHSITAAVTWCCCGGRKGSSPNPSDIQRKAELWKVCGGSSELTSAWRALAPSLSRVHGQLVQARGGMLSGGFQLLGVLQLPDHHQDEPKSLYIHGDFCLMWCVMCYVLLFI